MTRLHLAVIVWAMVVGLIVIGLLLWVARD